ncbi:DUF1232 domain-containing protein [Gelidibacter japonicus]|uniref:DUF1232 domain-containing protein n=1 Tax=Gelidibacter japonicus TaxID=1962232 RepID=UPI003A927396
MNKYTGFDYSQLLEDNTSSYKGKHEIVITNAKHIFDLMIKILDDPELTLEYRKKLLSVIGYFILPKDLYPEDEYGAIGYVDDILASLKVIKEIEESPLVSPLDGLWNGKLPLDELLNRHYENLRNDYSDLFYELIEYLGLN